MNCNNLYQSFPILKDIKEERKVQLNSFLEDAPLSLLSKLNLLIIKKGKTVIKEGDAAKFVFVLISGSLRAIDYQAFGISYEFHENDCLYRLGAMEVFMDEDFYRSSLTTISDCVLLQIPREEYTTWLRSNPDIFAREAKDISRLLFQQGRKKRSYLSLQGSNRLYMLFMQRYEQEAPNDGTVIFTMTRQTLSERSGLCIKTVNRTMKRMFQNNIISRKGNRIVMDKEQYNYMSDILSGLLEESEKENCSIF